MTRSRRRLGRSLLLAVLVLASLAFQTPAAPGLSAADPVAFAQSAPPTPPTPSGTASVVRVYFTSLADRDRLASQIDALETPTAGGYITAIVDDAQRQTLAAAGYRVEVDQGRTTLLNQPATRLPGQLAGIAGYPCYRTVEETYASMARLAVDHPNLAAWINIGQSWKKLTTSGAAGYDLKVLILTNKSRPGPKPTFFLMAALHAREYSTAELAARFAEYLVSQYGVDPDVTWLLDYFQVDILPQANPDGRKIAEAGLYQRKNVNNTNGGTCSTTPTPWDQFGTDLNRNSSFVWGLDSGSSSDPCSQTYRGPSALSEPETQAIQNYVASIFPHQRGPNPGDAAPAGATGILITLHSYAQEVLFPWGYTSDPAPNSTALQTLGNKFGYFNGYAVCQAPASGCLYSVSGTTDDWSYGELGVASYTFEIGTAFFEPCDSFTNATLPANMPALLYAVKAARRPYQAPAGPDTLQVTTALTTVVPGTPVTLTALADDTRYNSNGYGVEPTHPISAARYSLDAPAWVTGTTTYSLSPSDGAFDSPVENVRGVVDTTGWDPGRHLLFVESQAANGNWGVPSAAFITITSPYGLLAAPPAAAELGLRGTLVRYNLRVTQIGYHTDTFTVTLAGNTWPVQIPTTLGPMPQGQSASLPMTVTVPLAAANGAVDAASVTVTSAGDPAFHKTIVVTTTATAYGGWLPVINVGASK